MCKNQPEKKAFLDIDYAQLMPYPRPLNCRSTMLNFYSKMEPKKWSILYNSQGFVQLSNVHNDPKGPSTKSFLRRTNLCPPTSLPWHKQEWIELLLQHLISLHLHWHLNRPGAECHKSCSFLDIFLRFWNSSSNLVNFENHHQEEILSGFLKLLKLLFE